MAYTSTTWQEGDKATAAKLNNMETGISDAVTGVTYKDITYSLSIPASGYSVQGGVALADVPASKITGLAILHTNLPSGTPNTYMVVPTNIVVSNQDVATVSLCAMRVNTTQQTALTCGVRIRAYYYI